MNNCADHACERCELLLKCNHEYTILPSIPDGSAALSNMSYTNLYSTLDQSVTNWHNSTLFHSNLYNLLWVLIQGFLVFNFVLIDYYHNFGFCFVTCNQMHTGQGEIKCYSSNHPCHVCNLQVHQQVNMLENLKGKQGQNSTNLTYESHYIHRLTFTS